MSAPGFPSPRSAASSYLPSLDGLRAVAILLVLFGHTLSSRGFREMSDRTLYRLEFGSLGVELFFVLSGFLITTLLLRELRHTERVDLKRFYLRRILRIVPAYLCLLAVSAFLQAGGLIHLRAYQWVAAATYTTNFLPMPGELGHTWSLSVEEHFYLLWPLLLALLGVTASRRAALACLFLCPVARLAVLLLWPAHIEDAKFWTFTRIDTITTGCLLALLMEDKGWKQKFDRLVQRNGLMLLVFLCLVGSVGLRLVSTKLAFGFGYNVNALCLALLTWAAVQRADSPLGRLLNGRIMRFIGVTSYSLYLWQQLFLHRDGADIFCAFPQNFLFAFLAAALSYYLIERPFLSLKQRFSSGPAAMDATTRSTRSQPALQSEEEKKSAISWTETIPLPSRL